MNLPLPRLDEERHRIGAFVAEFAVTGTDGPLSAPERLAQQVRVELLPALEEVFADRALSDCDAVIGALELDLGHWPAAPDWAAVRARFREDLLSALAPYLRARSAAAPADEPLPSDQARPAHVALVDRPEAVAPAPRAASRRAQEGPARPASPPSAAADAVARLMSRLRGEAAVALLKAVRAEDPQGLDILVQSLPKAAHRDLVRRLASGRPSSGDLPGVDAAQRLLVSVFAAAGHGPEQARVFAAQMTARVLINPLGAVLSAGEVGTGLTAASAAADGEAAPAISDEGAAAEDQPEMGPGSERRWPAGDPVPPAAAFAELQARWSEAAGAVERELAGSDVAALLDLLAAALPNASPAFQDRMRDLAARARSPRAVLVRVLSAVLQQIPIDLAEIERLDRDAAKDTPARAIDASAKDAVQPAAGKDAWHQVIALLAGQTAAAAPELPRDGAAQGGVGHAPAEGSRPSTSGAAPDRADGPDHGFGQEDARGFESARSVAPQNDAQERADRPSEPVADTDAASGREFAPGAAPSDAAEKRDRPTEDYASRAADTGPDAPGTPSPYDAPSDAAEKHHHPTEDYAPRAADTAHDAPGTPSPYDAQARTAEGTASHPAAPGEVRDAETDAAGSGPSEAASRSADGPTTPGSDPAGDMRSRAQETRLPSDAGGLSREGGAREPGPWPEDPRRADAASTDRTPPADARPAGAAAPESGALAPEAGHSSDTSDTTPSRRASTADQDDMAEDRRRAPVDKAAEPSSADARNAKPGGPEAGADQANLSGGAADRFDQGRPGTGPDALSNREEGMDIARRSPGGEDPLVGGAHPRPASGPDGKGVSDPSSQPPLSGADDQAAPKGEDGAPRPQDSRTARDAGRADPPSPDRLADSDDPLENTAPADQAQLVEALATAAFGLSGAELRRMLDLIWSAMPAPNRAEVSSRMPDLAPAPGADVSNETPSDPLITRAEEAPHGLLLALIARAGPHPADLMGLLQHLFDLLAPEQADRHALLRQLISRLDYVTRAGAPALQHGLLTGLRHLADATKAGTTTPDQTPTAAFAAPGPAQHVLTRHAGLVLFHPYLKLMFSRLELLTPESRMRPGALPVGRAALEALAGAREPLQLMDPLARVLLGMTDDLPPPPAVALDEAQIALVDGLMRSVIAQWAKLGQTSPAGLQEAFVRRGGQIRFDELGAHLQVDPGPFDMLLDGLPWRLDGVVALPWMPAPCHVSWRSQDG